jgi:hypothetical protein
MKTTLILFLFIFLTSCGLDIGAGTHGSIKAYKYPVTKSELEKAILKIVENDSTIHRDYRAGQYNDTKNYLTMTIKSQDNEYEYTFRYLGDSLLWSNSQTSEIFICYIYDGQGNGGSAGNGKFELTDKKMQNDMINVFENSFVNKIDKELNQKHVSN